MAILGMAIGAITGWLSSLVLKSGTGGVIRDSFLGWFGYLAGFYGCIFMPWPRNTSSEGFAGRDEINNESALRAGVRRCGDRVAGAARVVSFEAKAYGYWLTS
jgi:uncharacterized membrane protein YeaQ/YmgE (transglycosylase-associated protein family)